MIDSPRDAGKRAVTNRVGDDARAEAHRHLARRRDQRAGQRRRLVALRRCYGDACGQAEQRRPTSVEHAAILTCPSHLWQQIENARQHHAG